MNIIFMGTPDFAVPCLKKLIELNYNVSAVFTQPDKKKGRGQKLQPPPIKETALEHGIKVYQPESLKTEEVETTIKELKPDIIIVVAFGKILPKNILEIPKYGCVNIHASLLPKYRGAGPIQWSVLNGETITGVTSMYMAQGLDTGDMILKAQTEIGENETASELHDRLSVMGADVLAKTLIQIESGKAQRIPQDESLSTYAPMLTKEMSLIDFSKSAEKVHNQIRGLSEWPCAVTYFQNKRLKVYKSKIRKDLKGQPGTILSQKEFVVACGEDAVEFLTVQYEGSKKMDAKDFLRGRTVIIGEKLENEQ